MKKVLSLVLVALMVVGAFIVTTSAENEASAPYSGTPLDKAFYSKTNKTIEISTAEQLLFVLNEANTNGTPYAGKTIKLVNDIVFNEGDYTKWEKTPPKYNLGTLVGNTGGFAGTFDGDGHTISGLYINRLEAETGTDPLTGLKVSLFGTNTNQQTGYVGLFTRVAADAKICNLRITNSYFSGTYATGAIVGCVVGDNVVIENVQVDNSIVYATYTQTSDPSAADEKDKPGPYEKHCSSGGIVGMTSGNYVLTFKDVLYHGTVVGCGRFVGGICGNMQKCHLILKNVGFIGNYESRYGDVYKGVNLFKENSGGLIGRVTDNALADYAEIGAQIDNCFFVGYFKANSESTTSGLLSGRCDTCTVNNFYGNKDAYKNLLGETNCKDFNNLESCNGVKKSVLTGKGAVATIGLDDNVWYDNEGVGPMLKAFEGEHIGNVDESINVGGDDQPAASSETPAPSSDEAPASSDTTPASEDPNASQGAGNTQAAPASSSKKASSTRRPASHTGDITTYMIAAVVISAAAAVVISKSRKA